MKRLTHRGPLHSPVFYIELHSSQPDQMAKFYEDTLFVKFKSKSYPFPYYVANLGCVTLIISESPRADIESAPGKVTLGVLTSGQSSLAGDKYFLPPQRPLGRRYPERYAARVRDPEGHYLALASSMEAVMGRIPPINSLAGITDCVVEYGLVLLERMRNRLRHMRDDIIDRWEYRMDRATIINRDIAGFTHLVASREGLFVVRPGAYRRVMRGSFFGATVRDGSVYLFQSCGWLTENRGRVLRLRLLNNQIKAIEVIAKGLDDGCHQIDFIGDDLFVVDCYNGRILQLQPGAVDYVAHYPLGQITREVARGQYHMNSIAAHPDGTLWLLLHNKNRRPSEILVVNAKFETLRRFPVEAGGAHNIVFTNDEHEYLIADSSGSRLISARGVVADINMMRPRGVSLDHELCVVGDSFYGTRPFRRYIPGLVHFFDRTSWKCTSSLSLPAAPTEIRRIDGKDFSLSNYVCNFASSPQSVATHG